VELGILDPASFRRATAGVRAHMDRTDKAKPRDPMSDVVFSGCRPPAPEPVPEPVRRDSMGRLIHETALEALKKTQFAKSVACVFEDVKRNTVA